MKIIIIDSLMFMIYIVIVYVIGILTGFLVWKLKE